MSDSFLPPVAQRSKQFTSLDGVGHRKRMRTKLLQKGGQAFEDYELLEMMLYLTVPRRDTKPIAKHLINEFGSFEAIINADLVSLKNKKTSPDLIQVICLFQQISERLILPDNHNRPHFKRWKDVITYLDDHKLEVAIEKKKVLRLLYLNNQQRLICDEYVLHQGLETISLVIKKALSLYAMNLITIYYVIDDVFSPIMRKDEAKFFLTLKSSARIFDLNIGDHIICNDSKYFSIFKDKAVNHEY